MNISGSMLQCVQLLTEKGDHILSAVSIVPNINDTSNIPHFYDLMAVSD